jgi:hypothetical protein
MFFAWTPTFGLDGARIGDLRRTLASGLDVPMEDVWVENATYENQTSQVTAKVIFYPPAGAQKWNKSQVTLIDFTLANKTIKLPDYDPYGLISSNLQTVPLNQGKESSCQFGLSFPCKNFFIGEVGVATFFFLTLVMVYSESPPPSPPPPPLPITSNKSNHQSLPIIAGVIGGFVVLVLLSSLLICFIKRRRTPNYSLDNASGNACKVFEMQFFSYLYRIFSFGVHLINACVG